MSKYELSISTGYVPDWGIVEAFRELFQNALDNEIKNPKNTMSTEYNSESMTLKISNKTSSLEKDSLLLGSSTKTDDKDTIGQHGEGYKIAFMVLLRNKKTITVYNYGKREIWQVKLVKSRRYNNQEVPVVFVEKNSIWNKVPNNNLTIVVGNITSEEYEDIKKKNLHLRDEPLTTADVTNKGRILLDESEKGNIYVKGLFVANKKDFSYGYDFAPSIISLDRDRKIVDSIRIAFETSALWNVVIKNDDELKDTFIQMFKNEVLDVKYAVKTFNDSYDTTSDTIAANFIKENGEDAVPVTNNTEYDEVASLGKTPVIVSTNVADAIKQSSLTEVVTVDAIQTLKERFLSFKEKIADKLTTNELEEFERLISKIPN